MNSDMVKCKLKQYFNSLQSECQSVDWNLCIFKNVFQMASRKLEPKKWSQLFLSHDEQVLDDYFTWGKKKGAIAGSFPIVCVIDREREKIALNEHSKALQELCPILEAHICSPQNPAVIPPSSISMCWSIWGLSTLGWGYDGAFPWWWRLEAISTTGLRWDISLDKVLFPALTGRGRKLHFVYPVQYCIESYLNKTRDIFFWGGMVDSISFPFNEER